MLELRRTDAFPRADLMRATMLAEFASRAVENDRLIGEARDREEERTRLTESLITAEQDERRRLSIFLHDGPLQSMSGIALMHDAALAALEEGRIEDATKVIRSSLERERDTIRTLRDLSFAIEPLVLRDRGFAAAVDALVEQVEGAHDIRVDADVERRRGSRREGAGRPLPAHPRGREPGRASKLEADHDHRRRERRGLHDRDRRRRNRRAPPRRHRRARRARSRSQRPRLRGHDRHGHDASGSCCRRTWAPQPSRIRARWRTTRKPGTSSSSRSRRATSWSSARAMRRPRAPRSRQAISASRSRRSARHRSRDDARPCAYLQAV